MLIPSLDRLERKPVCFDRLDRYSVCFDHARLKQMCSTVLDPSNICFNCAGPNSGIFRLSNNINYPNLNVITYAFRVTSYEAFFYQNAMIRIKCNLMQFKYFVEMNELRAEFFPIMENWFAI